MKKFGLVFAVIVAAAVVYSAAVAQDIKYKESSFDLFGIRLSHPEGWTLVVEPDYLEFQNPDDHLLSLVYYQSPDQYGGNLEDYFNDYKNDLVKENNAEIISAKPMEIAGYGAYYVKGKDRKGDFGHIIFIRNKSLQVLGLLTAKDKYAEYEPILMNAAESFSMYEPSPP